AVRAAAARGPRGARGGPARSYCPFGGTGSSASTCPGRWPTARPSGWPVPGPCGEAGRGGAGPVAGGRCGAGRQAVDGPAPRAAPGPDPAGRGRRGQAAGGDAGPGLGEGPRRGGLGGSAHDCWNRFLTIVSTWEKFSGTLLLG